MGVVSSKVKLLIAAVYHILELSADYDRTLKRIKADPGLPVPNPTLSFWQDVPSPLASRRPDALPVYADVVILGSGISGTSIARTLLDEVGGGKLKVVMLEARDVCSGATGRNGGHIKPPLHHDYLDMKKLFGPEQAAKLIRFRLMHFREMQRVAMEEDIVNESQCREVESLDVYLSKKPFEEAKTLLDAWKVDMPEEAAGVCYLEGEEAIERYRLSPDVSGVVYNQAAAIHPYRFVTLILARLLKRHADRFCLATHTPCTSIRAPSASAPDYYEVITPRGTIRSPHVVHATNAWCSHLLPALRAKIFCVCGTMTAQRPGTALAPSTRSGARSWAFYDAAPGYDFLTQLPDGESELMFGGFRMADAREALGTSDDAVVEQSAATRIAGVLPMLFGERNWGAEGRPPAGAGEGGSESDARWFDGRVKALWSGVLGVSVDFVPWVGRLPPSIAGRSAPPSKPPHAHTGAGMAPDDLSAAYESDTKYTQTSMTTTAAPGEWLCAGYNGEGMAHAFLSGRALALHMLGRAADAAAWFPECMGVSVERWKKANIEGFMEEMMGD